MLVDSYSVWTLLAVGFGLLFMPGLVAGRIVDKRMRGHDQRLMVVSLGVVISCVNSLRIVWGLGKALGDRVVPGLDVFLLVAACEWLFHARRDSEYAEGAQAGAPVEADRKRGAISPIGFVWLGRLWVSISLAVALAAIVAARAARHDWIGSMIREIGLFAVLVFVWCIVIAVDLRVRRRRAS